MTRERGMPVAVVICTYRRSAILRRTLARLEELYGLDPDWELIVVDNAGDAATEALIGEFAGRLPVRRVVEPVPGVARARNRGWREARLPLLAYLDDDCLPVPQWLARIRGFFASAPATSAGMLGGRVELLWEVERPTWLSDEFVGYLSRIDWGDGLICLPDESRWVGEGNMAILRERLAAVDGFPEALGRKGSGLLSHEGNGLRRKLEARGWTTWFDGAMEVSHIVFEERVRSRGWLYRRVFWGGVSDAALVAGSQTPGERRRAARKYFFYAVRTRWLLDLLPLPGCGLRMDRACAARAKLGYLLGLCGYR